ncbi:hypothetical protein DYB36_008816, partial [Aphanomyces astaci]
VVDKVDSNSVANRQLGASLSVIIRLHVFNSVAESVTLVREMNVQYAPVTTQGVVPLAKNSRIFGQSGCNVEFPKAYIGCLQSAADANYYLGKQLTSKHISDSLDRTM